MAGDGIALTSAEDGVLFELKPGRLGQWAWTEIGSDDAFLVLDTDDSGRIQDGSELFGDGSPQVASGEPNGFRALQYYDWPEMGGNGDGVIDARDKVWSRLRLWRDADHDAYSATYELTTLDAAGVHAFSLAVTAASHFDAHGNETRFTATVVADTPVATTVQDVWLTQAPLPTDDISGLRGYTQWTCTAWTYAIQYALPNPPPNQPPQFFPCERAEVAADPFAISGDGIWSKLVIRRSIGSDAKSAHMARARSKVYAAIGNTPDTCFVSYPWIWPTPDAYPPPYESGDPSIPRVKCTSQYIPDGGGGCAR